MRHKFNDSMATGAQSQAHPEMHTILRTLTYNNKVSPRTRSNLMQVNKAIYQYTGAPDQTIGRQRSLSRAIEKIRELKFLKEAILYFDYFIPITRAESNQVFALPKGRWRRRIQIGLKVKIRPIPIKEPEWEIDIVDASTDDVYAAIEETVKTYFGVDDLGDIKRGTFADFVLSHPPALIHGSAEFLSTNSNADKPLSAFSKCLLELHKALRVDRPIERIHPKMSKVYKVDNKLFEFSISLDHYPRKEPAQEFWESIRP